MTQAAYDNRADILPGGVDRFELMDKSDVIAGLVDVAGSILSEMSFLLPNGERNKDLDHIRVIVSALTPLAADLAELCDKIRSMPLEVEP